MTFNLTLPSSSSPSLTSNHDHQNFLPPRDPFRSLLATPSSTLETSTMRLYPEEVARYFGIANLADFDVKKHDLGTSPTTRKPVSSGLFLILVGALVLTSCVLEPQLIDAIDAASKDEVTAFWVRPSLLVLPLSLPFLRRRVRY